jgi:predicted lipase
MKNLHNDIIGLAHILNLKYSAKLSKLVYKDLNYVIAYNKKYNISTIEPIYIDNKDTGAQAYILKKNNTLYFVFRGTQELKDIIEDLNILRVKFDENTLVHKGFYQQFDSLIPLIAKIFIEKNLHDDINTMYFIGHSLGGALATLASAHYGKLFQNKYIICHTFGCPRVGNSAFTKMFSKYVNENTRVYNKDDPVPMVPLTSRFRHVKEGLCIYNESKYEYIRKDIKWYKRIFYTLRNINYSDISKDHDCNVYIYRLSKLSNKTENIVFNDINGSVTDLKMI